MILVTMAAAAVYANTLTNGFVYDDRFQVVENPWIRDLRHIATILTSGAWEFEGSTSNYYRPVMHVIYTLTYAFAGLNSWAYHTVSVVLHTAASLLVLFFVEALLDRAGTSPAAASAAATAAGLLFALHPIHTEAVAWVAGVPELTFTVCSLASLLLYLRASPAKSSWRGVLAAILFFVALLSKETALALPGVFVALDVSSGSGRMTVGSRLRRYLPFLAVAVVYVALRLAAVPDVAPLRRHANLSSYEVLINIFPLFTKYLTMLVVPFGLNAFHVLHPLQSLFSLQGVLSLAITGLFAASCIVTARRRSPALVGLALVFLPLVPVLYIPFLGENTFAERYLYLPSVGLATIVALGLAWLAERRPRLRRPVAVFIAAILVLWSGMTVTRNRVWRDDFSLWTTTVAQSPDSGYVNNEAGIAYAERGMLDTAIRHYELAVRLSPRSERIWNNLGDALAERGEIVQAVEHFRRAIAIKPTFAKAYNNLGNALARLGRFADAEAKFERALELTPGAVEIRLNLGNLYGAQGQGDRAMEQYQEALRLAPESADVHLHLGIAYGERGDLKRAISHLERAARLAPSDPIIRQNLSHAYALRDTGFSSSAAAPTGQPPAGP